MGVRSVGKSCGKGLGKKQKWGQRQRREKKEVKKQGQYTQRNVVLQTVELAKLKCTVTMGTLGEKKRK